MQIDMDVNKHQYHGEQKVIYTNNSPDTLSQMYYHFYFNAFQPGSDMDIRSRTIIDPDKRVGDRISKLKSSEIGFIQPSRIMQNGIACTYRILGTICEVTLNTPILPGNNCVMEMQWLAQVPIQIRRSGRNNAEGVDYSMAQWYPKICAYDQQGWHANTYIAREFYGNWGSYDVKIKIDQNYTVAAGAVLQNPDMIGKGYSQPGVQPGMVPDTKGKITWHFKSENVHDFAWAADPDYKHEKVMSQEGVLFRFFYIPGTKTNATWKEFKEHILKGFSWLNTSCGKYPYPEYSIIQGGDGGMEYPMATLVTGERPLGSLVGVTLHEMIHSWYYGILGTDEGRYPWMDEGFTEYFTELSEHQVWNTAFPDTSYPSLYNGYFKLLENKLLEPLTTHADHYQTNAAYGVASYVQGAMFLHQLKYIIGASNFQKGMLAYFEQWKYKHPTPQNFIRVMEKQSGIHLDWFHNYWIETQRTIDYSIESINKKGRKNTKLEMKNSGNFPMPIVITVILKNQTKKKYYIPTDLMQTPMHWKPESEMELLEPWRWVQSNYTCLLPLKMSSIAEIILDDSWSMADINRKDNTWKPVDE